MFLLAILEASVGLSLSPVQCVFSTVGGAQYRWGYLEYGVGDVQYRAGISL